MLELTHIHRYLKLLVSSKIAEVVFGKNTLDYKRNSLKVRD